MEKELPQETSKLSILEDIQAEYRIILQEYSRGDTCSIGELLYNVLRNAVLESDLGLKPGSWLTMWSVNQSKLTSDCISSLTKNPDNNRILLQVVVRIKWNDAGKYHCAWHTIKTQCMSDIIIEWDKIIFKVSSNFKNLWGP